MNEQLLTRAQPLVLVVDDEVRSQEALRRTLELRVQERTAELEVANRHLSEEITERRRIGGTIGGGQLEFRAIEQARREERDKVAGEYRSRITAAEVKAAAGGKTKNDAPVIRHELVAQWLRGWGDWHEQNPADDASNDEKKAA